MAGLTRADFFLCAQRILDVRDGEDVPRVTLRTTKNPKVSTLNSWAHFRKWKSILLQELSSRDPKKRGIWGKDSEGFDCLDQAVWNKLKRKNTGSQRQSGLRSTRLRVIHGSIRSDWRTTSTLRHPLHATVCCTSGFKQISGSAVPRSSHAG